MYEKLDWQENENGSREATCPYTPDTDGENQRWTLAQDKEVEGAYLVSGPWCWLDDYKGNEDGVEAYVNEADALAAIEEHRHRHYVQHLESQLGRMQLLERHEDELREQAQKCQSKRAVWEDFKVCASDAKKQYDAACEELAKMAAMRPTHGPLFEKPADTTTGGEDAAGGAQAEAWRDADLQELVQHGAPQKVIDKMKARVPALTTIGQLADWMNAPHSKLTDLQGVGKVTAEKVADAQTAWFAANPDKCPRIDEGSEADMADDVPPADDTEADADGWEEADAENGVEDTAETGV